MSVAAQIVENLLDGDIDPKDELDGMQARDPHFGIPDKSNLDSFTRQYIQAILFTEEERLGEEVGDQGGSIEFELSQEALWKAAEDCANFQQENAADLESGDSEMAGQDFWLTRNRHGAGFWDGDWPDDVGQRLTAAAHAYGEVDVWADEEGNVYFG